jgi:hypothetical protein
MHERVAAFPGKGDNRLFRQFREKRRLSPFSGRLVCRDGLDLGQDGADDAIAAFAGKGVDIDGGRVQVTLERFAQQRPRAE